MQLLLALFLVGCGTEMSRAADGPSPDRFATAAKLDLWARQAYARPTVTYFEADGLRLAVVNGNRGSGFLVKTVTIYRQSEKGGEWILSMHWYSQEAELAVAVTEGKLTFTSDDGVVMAIAVSSFSAR